MMGWRKQLLRIGLVGACVLFGLFVLGWLLCWNTILHSSVSSRSPDGNYLCGISSEECDNRLGDHRKYYYIFLNSGDGRQIVAEYELLIPVHDQLVWFHAEVDTDTYIRWSEKWNEVECHIPQNGLTLTIPLALYDVQMAPNLENHEGGQRWGVSTPGAPAPRSC